MKTLENLFYGNISPHERYIKQGSEVEKLVKLVSQTEDELNATLTEKQKEMFGKYQDYSNELSSICEAETFSTGFILATRIMIEVMDGMQEVDDA